MNYNKSTLLLLLLLLLVIYLVISNNNYEYLKKVNKNGVKKNNKKRKKSSSISCPPCPSCSSSLTCGQIQTCSNFKPVYITTTINGVKYYLVNSANITTYGLTTNKNIDSFFIIIYNTIINQYMFPNHFDLLKLIKVYENGEIVKNKYKILNLNDDNSIVYLSDISTDNVRMTQEDSPIDKNVFKVLTTINIDDALTFEIEQINN